MLITRHVLNIIQAGRKVNEITLEDFDLLIEVAEDHEGLISSSKLSDIKTDRLENKISIKDYDLLITIADKVLTEQESIMRERTEKEKIELAKIEAEENEKTLLAEQREIAKWKKEIERQERLSSKEDRDKEDREYGQ